MANLKKVPSTLIGSPQQSEVRFDRVEEEDQEAMPYDSNMSQTGGLHRGGTFSKANNPSNFKSARSSKSRENLFQRIMNEKNETNRSYKIPAHTKSASNLSYIGVQKSLAKLQELNQGLNNWSLQDQNPNVTYNSIGGKQDIFRKSSNLFTNDPSLYNNKEFNITERCSTFDHKRMSVP